MAPSIPIILHLKTCTEKQGGHYASFVLDTQHYRCVRNPNLFAMESVGEKPEESHNACPNNQLRTEKGSGHCALFVAMHEQTNNSVRNFSAMDSVPMENVGEKDKVIGSCIGPLQSTLFCTVSEKNWNKKLSPS